MKTSEFVNKIDLGQSLILIGVGMNNNGNSLIDSDWLRDDETDWDYCEAASGDDIAAIKDTLAGAGIDNDDWQPDHWLLFGRREINADGYLTGVEYRYAAYIG
jgi:hypothetical protein